MKELLNILPSWTRWALESPEHFIMFWWGVAIIFSVILFTLLWITEKGGKK